MQITKVAQCLLRIAAGEQVGERSLRELAEYFSGSNSETETTAFIQLTELVQKGVDGVSSFRLLLEKHRHRLAAPGVDEGHAADFINEFVELLGPALLWMQPLTMGYARRIQGSPFDLLADQSSGIPGWMIIYTREGSGLLDTGVRKMDLHPGHAALFEPGAVFSYQRAANSTVWGHYWIAFQTGASARELLNWPRVGPCIGYLNLKEQEQREIEQSLEQLHHSFMSASPLKTALDQNLLEQFLIRCQNSRPDDSQARVDERVQRAQTFIEDNYNRGFTLGDVASAANMSASRIAHLFRDQTGLTVMGWRDEKRMMAAAQMLRSGKMPISRIAETVGYVDAPFFSRTFKRLIGCTPREYRAR